MGKAKVIIPQQTAQLFADAYQLIPPIVAGEKDVATNRHQQFVAQSPRRIDDNPKEG
jgi:hypothetical protein